MAKIIDNYILLETMGEARLGEIQKGRNLINKDNVAVLTIKLDKFLNQNDMRDQIINEIQTLKKLQKNQNIMQMIKMLKSSNNIYLVYEFLEGTSLQQFVRDQLKLDHSLTEQECLEIFSQVIKAFQSITKEGIIKKNLNTSNIYLNKGVVKLKNFFYCKNGNGDDSQQKNLKEFQVLHHLEYVAPEILFSKDDQQSNYNESCDIYSLGLVLFFLLTSGQLPIQFQNQPEFTLESLQSIYTQMNPQQSILDDEKNINLLQQCGVSKNLQLILKNMLEINKEKRISWENLIQYSQNITINSTPKSKAKQYSLTSSNNSNKNLFANSQNNQNNQLSGSIRNSIKKKPSLTDNFGKSQTNNNNINNNNSSQQQNYQRNSKDFSQSLRSNRLNTNQNAQNNLNILQNNNSINSHLNTNGSYSDLKILDNNSTTNSNTKLQNYGFNQSYKSPTSSSNNLQGSTKNLNNTSLLQIQFQQKFQKFQDNIMQERSKMQIIMTAIQKCLNHINNNNQNTQIAIIYLLLKKSLEIQKNIHLNFKSQYQQFLTDKENTIHTNNTNKNNNEILNQIQIILQQELREIIIKFQMFTSDFLMNLNLNEFQNEKIVKLTLQEELQNLDEISNIQKLDYSLVQLSKKLLNSEDSEDKNIVLTCHYITDIGNIENVYQKFLGKKRIDILNHPYFKKLNDIQIDKLQDNLNNKFKLYEYQQQQQFQQQQQLQHQQQQILQQ